MLSIKQFDASDLYLIDSTQVHNFNDKLVLLQTEINELKINNIFPARTSAQTLLFVCEGSIDIEIDYTLHSLHKGSFLIILPEHLIVDVRPGNNFKGNMMIIDREYFREIEGNKNRIYQSNFMNIRRYPLIDLNDENLSVITSCWNRLEERIKDTEHHFREDLITILLTEFLLEIDNILVGQVYSNSLRKLSRSEEVFYNFLQLLKENGRSGQPVLFYADKLSVTTQHLAFVLKKITGKTTREWISDAMLIELKILLKHSDLNMEQIAEELNFCDPSAFGKWFKAQTGSTPFQYRSKYAY
jgi:AraC-like DNA-binding protein